MCGLVAFIDFQKKISKAQLDCATDEMILRGPDARGSIIIDEGTYNIGFGHRRLAILDLDERSNQPLLIGNYIIVFNGEIYNYRQIRAELESVGYSFITESDTEVIVYAYQEWGDLCVDRFLGMFAFFIYDQNTNNVLVVRDRLGVKPLYVFNNDNKLIIASEVKAILPLLEELPMIDEAALFGFFSLGYIHGNNSIFKNIAKIKPGSILKIELSDGLKVTQRTYWDINGINSSKELSDSRKEELKLLLEDAIKLRLIADVDIGSFLSGGLDSSYVTKILSENISYKKLNSYTIGFNEDFDEAPHAKTIAAFIGTEHHSHYLSSDDVSEIIKNYALYFDEPFSDDAAIPMLFLSRKAKNNVKVVISSDGGDELFAGYSRYIKALRAHEKISKIPTVVLNFTSIIAKLLFNIFPKRNRFSNSLWRINQVVNSGRSNFLFELLRLADMIPTPELETILDKSITGKRISVESDDVNKNLTPIKQLLVQDINGSLTNQMLVKVDKSTMGASIEGREPLLDHRLFELMIRLNDEDLINGNKTKYLFRQIIKDKFENLDILNKPKLGFNTPIYSWLRYSFNDFVEEQFNSIEKLSIPYLDQKELLKLWEEFKVGKVYYQSLVWRSLIFILWYKNYVLKINCVNAKLN